MRHTFNIDKLNAINRYKVTEGKTEIIERLQQAAVKHKTFNFSQERNSTDNFVISAKSSVGILISTEINISAKAISVFGHIDYTSDDCQTLTIKTKLRPEILLLSLLIIPVYIVMLINNDGIPFWAYLLPPIPIFWFQVVYRFQENNLIEKIERVLKIKPFSKQ